MAQRSNVLRGQPGPAPGLLPASREGGKGRNGHAFFYKSARAVSGCDESEQRQRFRRLKRDTPLPEFKDWRPWDGEIESGYFWTEDIRGVRAELLAGATAPRSPCAGCANGPRCGCECMAEQTA